MYNSRLCQRGPASSYTNISNNLQQYQDLVNLHSSNNNHRRGLAHRLDLATSHGFGATTTVVGRGFGSSSTTATSGQASTGFGQSQQQGFSLSQSSGFVQSQPLQSSGFGQSQQPQPQQTGFRGGAISNSKTIGTRGCEMSRRW